MTEARYTSDGEVEDIAQGFLDHTLAPTRWTHAAHVATAVYLIRVRTDLNPERDMPDLIRSYNLASGGANTDTAGYHETLTQAYLYETRRLLVEAGDGGLAASVNAVLDLGLADKTWMARYWRTTTLMSVAARKAWVPPDLMPLPPRRTESAGATKP